MPHAGRGRPAQWVKESRRDEAELARVRALTEAAARALAQHGLSEEDARSALASSHEEMRALEDRIAMARTIEARGLPAVTRPAHLGHVLIAARRIVNESQEVFGRRLGMHGPAFAASERRLHEGMPLARLDAAFASLGLRVEATPVMDRKP